MLPLPGFLFFKYVKSLAIRVKRARIHSPMIQTGFSPALEEKYTCEIRLRG